MNTIQKIGIYGGSFDPFHKGHQVVAQTAIEELVLDELYLVPAWQNPTKKNSPLVTSEHRLKMLDLVKTNKIKVSDFEIRAQKVSYTIDTINYFVKKFPNAQLFLIIGSDNLKFFHKWKNYEQILELAQLVVYQRDYRISKSHINKYKLISLTAKPLNFNSTEIRQGNLNQCPAEISSYIAKNFLYIDVILKYQINNGERLKHCYNTAKMAASLAKAHNSDAKIAYYAGLLHDITKTWEPEKHRLFLENHGFSNVDNLLNYQLHQLSAAQFLKSNYPLPYPEIVRAIECHTSLCRQMNLLDKIVYVSDKIAIGRRFEGVQQLRKLALEDIDAVFKILVKQSAQLHKEEKNSDEQNELYKIHS